MIVRPGLLFLIMLLISIFYAVVSVSKYVEFVLIN